VHRPRDSPESSCGWYEWHDLTNRKSQFHKTAAGQCQASTIIFDHVNNVPYLVDDLITPGRPLQNPGMRFAPPTVRPPTSNVTTSTDVDAAEAAPVEILAPTSPATIMPPFPPPPPQAAGAGPSRPWSASFSDATAPINTDNSAQEMPETTRPATEANPIACAKAGNGGDDTVLQPPPGEVRPVLEYEITQDMKKPTIYMRRNFTIEFLTTIGLPSRNVDPIRWVLLDGFLF
jgi:hypothetical protein